MPIRTIVVATALLALCLSVELSAPCASLAQDDAVGGFVGGDGGPPIEGIPYSEDFIDGAPKVTAVHLDKFAGTEGRLRLEVTVEYPHLMDEWDGLISDKASYVGRVSVTLGGCGAGSSPAGPSAQLTLDQAHALPMDTTGDPELIYTHVFQLTAEESAQLLSSAPCSASSSGTAARATGSLAAVASAPTTVGAARGLPTLRQNHGQVLVDVTATAGFDQFGDGQDDESEGVQYRRRVLIGRAAPRANMPFVCTTKADLQPMKFPITGLRYAWSPPRHLLAWMNESYDVRLCATDLKELTPGQIEVFSDPDHGTSSNLRIENGYLKVTYTPSPGYFGNDSFGYFNFATPATYDQITVNMSVKPFVMGAIGDSITAGWGYIGTGAAPQLSGNDQDFDIIQLKRCEPLDNLNNRCSSNSFVAAGDDRDLFRWTPDAGLGNNIAWPAQFANRHGILRTTNGFTTFDNRAVSGSRPQDWVQGGRFARDLDAMLQNNLTVLTLGANPILANTLLDTKLGKECADVPNNLMPQQEVDAAVKCMRGQLDLTKFYERLRAVYRRLLDGPRNRVVVMQYGLTFPAIGTLVPSFLANTYNPWTIEAMANVVNAEIQRAVEDEAQLARSQGKGDRLILASPGRFNMGLAGYPQVIGNDPGILCPTTSDPLSLGRVDGTSNQSTVMQNSILVTCHSSDPSQVYFEGLDGGLHLSRAGHKRFADALDAAVKDLNLPLPKP